MIKELTIQVGCNDGLKLLLYGYLQELLNYYFHEDLNDLIDKYYQTFWIKNLKKEDL